MNAWKPLSVSPLVARPKAQTRPAVHFASTGKALLPFWQAIKAAGQWLQRQGALRALAARNKRLRVSETVSLGEKRFLSIVEVDGHTFLIGGGAQTVSLLATYVPQTDGPEFREVLREQVKAGEQA